MAKMNGCNQEQKVVVKPQGTGRMAPGDFARTKLSQGGANKDLGGGAKTPGKGKR